MSPKYFLKKTLKIINGEKEQGWSKHKVYRPKGN